MQNFRPHPRSTEVATHAHQEICVPVNKKGLFKMQFSGSVFSFSFFSLRWTGKNKKPFSAFILSFLFLCTFSNVEKRGHLRPKATFWILV